MADNGVDSFASDQKNLSPNDRPLPDKQYFRVLIEVSLATFHRHALIDLGFSLADYVYLAVLLSLDHKSGVAPDDLVLEVFDELLEPFFLSLDIDTRIVVVKYFGESLIFYYVLP